MANEIKAKYSAPTAITMSLGGLASGSARQGTVIDNTTDRAQQVLVLVKVKLGTSPTSNRGVFFYLIRDDGAASSPLRTDNAGATDAAITLKNARQVGAVTTGGSAATGDVLYGDFLIDQPGPKWTLAAYNDSGAALDATGGNHTVEFVTINPEVQ